MTKRSARNFSVISFILALIFLLLSVFQTVQNYQIKKEYEKLETQNTTLQGQVNTVTADKEKLSDSLSKQKTENEKLQKELEEAQKVTSSATAPTSSATAQKQPTNVSKGKVAYLTFDDGPSSRTPRLLDILKENNVKATFFVIADSEDTPMKRKIMKRIVSEGHTIGVHSWSHNYNYIYKSVDNYNADFQKMYNMIESATGVKPVFMRFPGGTNNTVSIRCHSGTPIMPTLLTNYLNKGMIPVDWNVGGTDAVTPVPTSTKLVSDVVNGCCGRQKPVILLHDSYAHASSIEAVPEIIKQLKSQGYTFKALTSADEAMRTKPVTKK